MKKLLFLLCLLGAAWKVYSFNVDGSRWPEGEATFSVDIPGTAPSGISWNTAFEDALAEWNERTLFDFFIDNNDVDPCSGFSESDSGTGFPGGGGDGQNGADFAESVCGNEFGERVLAITLVLGSGGLLGFADIVQTDIIYNSGVDWDIYDGGIREQAEFHRVSLHELGHALGLGHEPEQPAIMAPSIGNIDSLQDDDINGINAIYGGPNSSCEIPLIAIDTVVNGSLEEGDCTVLELYNGGQDTSFVDAYRLILGSETGLTVSMESAVLDSVVLLTNTSLEGIEFNDDGDNTCNAEISGTFPAGEYLILANTYDEPLKCGGNAGEYRLTVTDNALPLLKNARHLEGQPNRAIFSGGASDEQGAGFKDSFAATEALNINARILLDPDHVGEPGKIHVMAVLGDGRRFVKTASGKFQAYTGGLNNLPYYRASLGMPGEFNLEIIEGFVPASLGLSDTTIRVYIGYSLQREPGNIHYSGDPIRVMIE